MSDLANYTAEELSVIEDALREDIERADALQNAVLGHDLRCDLDQVVAAREAQDAAAQDNTG